MISFEDFKKVDLRVARIIKAEKIEGSEKLLKLEIDLGQEKRQVVSGIGKFYAPNYLEGKEIAVVANLEPITLMGIESQAMILAADTDGQPVLIMPEKEISPGAEIK